MIVVDANYFLRYILRAETDADQPMFEAATALFRQANDGDVTFITSEAVVAEVVFILSSKRHQNVPRVEVAGMIRPLIGLRGCALPHKPRVLRALDLWAGHERISFVDALMAAYAIDLGAPLATFDRSLIQMAELTIWHPEDGPGGRSRATDE